MAHWMRRSSIEEEEASWDLVTYLLKRRARSCARATPKRAWQRKGQQALCFFFLLEKKSESSSGRVAQLGQRRAGREGGEVQSSIVAGSGRKAWRMERACERKAAA